MAQLQQYLPALGKITLVRLLKQVAQDHPSAPAQAGGASLPEHLRRIRKGGDPTSRTMSRETGEPRPTEATQDCDEDPLTNPDFEVDIIVDITENQIIITITKFFVFKTKLFWPYASCNFVSSKIFGPL
jgi:hypothetical protein